MAGFFGRNFATGLLVGCIVAVGVAAHRPLQRLGVVALIGDRRGRNPDRDDAADQKTGREIASKKPSHEKIPPRAPIRLQAAAG